MGRWQREALTEGLWREAAAPPPSPAATVPLPIASRQGGSDGSHQPKAAMARCKPHCPRPAARLKQRARSEEHTSELQSLMRNSYAVFCLKKKTKQQQKK